MPINTTDVRSNSEAQILHAADLLSKSEDRRKVFKEIYRGNSKGKTAEDIATEIKIDTVRVLQEALVLYKAGIIEKEKINGRLTYLKDDFYSLNRDKILRLATNEPARSKLRAYLFPSFANEKTPIKTKIKYVTPKIRHRKTITILFLAANPKDTVNLRLDEEVREIEHRIMLAQKKEEFTLIKKGAVRVGNLQLYLNQERPTIVHFSGHGTSDGKIILEDNAGIGIAVAPVALARVFNTLKDNVRCIVLNACFSLEQAEAINENIDCVIGMSSSISDEAAIAFSSAFYLALASGRSVKNAFDQGINELLLMGIPEENIPQLLTRDEIDASKIVIFK